MTNSDNSHLTPETIAAYVDRTALSEDRRSVEAHVSHCSECRHELVTVTRVVRSRRARRGLLIAVPAAAAAAFALIFLGLPEGGGVPGENAVVTRAREGEGIERFEIVAPSDLDSVGVSSLEFVWRSVEPGASYRLTLTNADGDVLWVGNSEDTSLALPDDIRSSAEGSCYWYVDALLEGGLSATTGVSRFLIVR